AARLAAADLVDEGVHGRVSSVSDSVLARVARPGDRVPPLGFDSPALRTGSAAAVGVRRLIGALRGHPVPGRGSLSRRTPLTHCPLFFRSLSRRRRGRLLCGGGGV